MAILDYEDDELWADLKQIVEDVRLVEEIPVKRIRELCRKRRVDCLGFLSDWADLAVSCDEVASEAEHIMSELHSEERRERRSRTEEQFIEKYGG